MPLLPDWWQAAAVSYFGVGQVIGAVPHARDPGIAAPLALAQLVQHPAPGPRHQREGNAKPGGEAEDIGQPILVAAEEQAEDKLDPQQEADQRERPVLSVCRCRSG